MTELFHHLHPHTILNVPSVGMVTPDYCSEAGIYKLLSDTPLVKEAQIQLRAAFQSGAIKLLDVERKSPVIATKFVTTEEKNSPECREAILNEQCRLLDYIRTVDHNNRWFVYLSGKDVLQDYVQLFDNLTSPDGNYPGISQRAGIMIEAYRGSHTRKLENYIASEIENIKLVRKYFRGEILVGIDTHFDSNSQPIPADDVIAAGRAFLKGANGLCGWNFGDDKSLHPEMGKIVEGLR